MSLETDTQLIHVYVRILWFLIDHTSCVLGVVKLSTKVAKKIKGKKEEEA